MSEIKLNATAITTLQQGVTSPTFTALRKGVLDSAASNNKVMFVTGIQNLITELALIVSDSLETPKLEGGAYYSNAATYLTKSVIGDDSLYNYLLASKINENGNTVKHSLDEISGVDVDTIIYIFNRLLSFLVLKLEADCLTPIKLVLEDKKSEMKPSGFKSIWGESEAVKHFVLNENKIKVELDKFCYVDIYKKTIIASIAVDVEEGNPSDNITVEIKNLKGEELKKLLVKPEKYPFRLCESFTVADSDIEADKLTIEVLSKIVSIEKEKKEEAVRVPYSSGGRFGATQYRTTYKLVLTDVEKVLASSSCVLSTELSVRK